MKWEYLWITYGFDGRTWRVWYIGSEEQKDWKKLEDFAEHSARLGTEGWELVATGAFNFLPQARMVTGYKRPLSG